MGGREIYVQIEKDLSEYSEEVRKESFEVFAQVAQEAVTRLKATSPRSKGGGKHYASGWRAKKDKKNLRVVVHNATKPGLTYLLEESHPIKNQYGTFGMSKAMPHIRPVEEWANEEAVRRVEEVLSKGD